MLESRNNAEKTILGIVILAMLLLVAHLIRGIMDQQ